MRRLLEQLYDVSRYDNLIEKDRARLVYTIASALILINLFFIGLIVFAPRNAIPDPAVPASTVDTNIFLVGFTVFVLGLIASFVVTRRGNSRLGSVLLVSLTTLIFGGLVIVTGAYRSQDGFALIIAIAIPGLLLGERGLLVGIGSAVLIYIASVSLRSESRTINLSASNEAAITVTLIFIIGSLIYAYLRFARVSRIEGAATAEAERMKLAQLTSLITSRISRRLAPSEVLRNTVEEIRTSYPDIYHAQIFLTEPSGVARLVASTGEVGKMLIDRQHSLPIGSQSVIGQVTLNNQTVIARSNSSNSVHKRNEFLPDTVVEAAFPMRIGDAVIGALDLQSKKHDTFTDEEMPIFQSLADNVAIAIDNARLFEETERRLQENQQLVAQMRQSSEEVKRLNERLTGRFWKDFLNQQNASSLLLDLESSSAVVDNTWTPSIREAITSNQSIQSNSTDTKLVTVPLRVRGQVIGAMEFEIDQNGTVSADDIAMMEEVSEQLGLAAESNRLYETSQRIAQREALVNEISTRLQSGTSVEMTLNSAARSLKDVLKANRVAIRLGKPPVETMNGDNS
ncbi:MAG: GAF domain-containing protein [Anaerolineaceae bacterium]|nr:GAF domain-containing protein [Anaerolineaceae bacterium]